MGSKDVNETLSNNIYKPGKAERVEVTFYTDPLCCWSWAIRPQWEQLLEELDGSISATYKMAGLLPSWHHFNDPVNSISKPIQMGPEWMHAKVVSGAQINNQIWITDPPASSFPACIAVKCAGLQSKAAEDRYLYLLQKAVMVDGLNIARTSVLLDVAAAMPDAFDLSLFKQDLLGERGKEAFRQDMQECKYLNIVRLPTLIFRRAGSPSLLLSGYQSYRSLKKTYGTLVDKY
jgi:predicted DsbA family dithiol-disulfide isomerase